MVKARGFESCIASSNLATPAIFFVCNVKESFVRMFISTGVYIFLGAFFAWMFYDVVRGIRKDLKRGDVYNNNVGATNPFGD